MRYMQLVMDSCTAWSHTALYSSYVLTFWLQRSYAHDGKAGTNAHLDQCQIITLNWIFHGEEPHVFSDPSRIRRPLQSSGNLTHKTKGNLRIGILPVAFIILIYRVEFSKIANYVDPFIVQPLDRWQGPDRKYIARPTIFTMPLCDAHSTTFTYWHLLARHLVGVRLMNYGRVTEIHFAYPEKVKGCKLLMVITDLFSELQKSVA